MQWSQLEQLGGKATDGSWRTASAKEYPPLMNQALAFALVSRASEAQEVIPPGEICEQANLHFEDLHAGSDNYSAQEIQPDFHQKVRKPEDEMESD